METLFGVATHVCRTAAVYGNENGVDTIQTVTFRIGSQAVEVSMPDLPQIDDGDQVAVSGDVRKGTLRARAYMNCSNGSYDRRWVPSNSIATFLGLIAFGWLGQVCAPPVGLLFLGLAPLALLWWLSDIRQSCKNRRALRLVRSQARRESARRAAAPLAV